MANKKSGLGGQFLGWLSQKLHAVQEAKPKIKKEVKMKAASQSLRTSEGLVIQEVVAAHTEASAIERSHEPTSEVELSEELQQLLQETRFAPLRDALRLEGITTLVQLERVQLWVFLNQHNLYSITERSAIFDYLHDQLNQALEREKELVVEKTFIEESSVEKKSVEESAAEGPYIDQESVVAEGSSKVKLQTLQDSFKTPYYELYSLDPETYRTFSVSSCGFSVRVSNRLKGHNIKNVGKLLEQSDEIMLAISGFGTNSLKELHAYFEKLIVSDSEDSPALTRKTCNHDKFVQEPYDLIDDELIENVKKSEPAALSIVQMLERFVRERECKHADLIDVELIENVKKSEPAALSIVQMLEEFVRTHECEQAYKTTLAKLPTKRLGLLAEVVLHAFTNNEERLSLLLQKNDRGDTLEQFIVKNANLIVCKDPLMTMFLRWCAYDVVTDLETFFDNHLQKTNYRRIFCGRVRGDTLAQLGDELGVTRERIRQIESKIIKTAKNWFRRNRIIYKIFLDFGGEAALSVSQIVDSIGQYGLETVA